MIAAYINQPGPPESIIVGQVPKPSVAGTQVLVRVGAVSVNPIDTYVRAGDVKMELPVPFILGCDVAGTVEEVGPDVRHFKPGDRVWGSNQGLLGRQGTFAEYAAIDECWLYPTPEGIADADVAAVALVGITAHLGLFVHARLQPGETLFVNGGSGGVGSMVVQMAKAAGARVATTAGSDAKLEKVHRLGADLAINYKTQDVDGALRAFAPEGVHVWWETQRQPDFDRTVALLARRGRMVLMAGRDARPAFPVGPFYVKDCSLLGFAMFNASSEEQRAAAENINRWLSLGKLHANIDRILPLSEAALAHQLQEASTVHQSGALAGKLVLRP